MEDGSSVDVLSNEGVKEPDGLNVTSEILREDEEFEKSSDSFLEDSIDQRAAKALKISSVKELVPRRNRKTKKSPKQFVASPTDPLVNVIYNSMTTDLRRAACSVSPSPHRKSRRASCGTYSACTTTSVESISTPSSLVNSTPGNVKTPTQQLHGDCNLSKEMQHISNLPLLNDDSFQSEPELDLAFNRLSSQTMDILSAAGNLQERRGVHGGYGTPSSYASEQEMKLYFDDTPVRDLEQSSFDLNDDNQDSKSKQLTGHSLQAIEQLEEKMKQEIIVKSSSNTSEQQSDSSLQNDESFRYQQDEITKPPQFFSAAAVRCANAVKKLENFAYSDAQADDNDSPLQQKPVQKQRHHKSRNGKFSLRKTSLARRNSDSVAALKVKKRGQMSRQKMDAKSRLYGMLKSASESLIDNDVSDAMVINLTTPDVSRVQPSKDLAPFDFFQECLRELKSFDNDSAETASYQESIPKNFSLRNVSDDDDDETASYQESIPKNFSLRNVSDDDDNEANGQKQLCFEEANGFTSDEKNNENFINDSLAATYNSPLLCDLATNHETTNDVHDDDFLASDSLCSGNQTEENLSLDLDSLNSYETSSDDSSGGRQSQCCDAEIIELKPASPIYFERENDQNGEACTAQKHLDFRTEIVNVDNRTDIRSLQTFNPEEDLNSNKNFTNKDPEEYVNSDNVLQGHLNVEYYHTKDLVQSYQNGLQVDNCKRNCKLQIFDDRSKGLKSDEIARFADDLTAKVVEDFCLNQKKVQFSSRCESENESGYCTTSESRAENNNAISCNGLTSQDHSTDTKMKQSNNEVKDKKDNKEVTLISNQILSNDIDCEQQCSDQTKISECPNKIANKDNNDKSNSIVSQPIMFEVKASLFEKCIQSYEEYQPQLLLHLSEVKETLDDAIDSTIDLNNKAVSKKLGTNLQGDSRSTQESTKSVTCFSASDAAKPTVEVSFKDSGTCSVIKEDYSVVAHSDHSAEDSSIHVLEEFREKDDAVVQVHKEPDKKLSSFNHKNLNQKSTLPKILVTCPSIDVADSQCNDSKVEKSLISNETEAIVSKSCEVSLSEKKDVAVKASALSFPQDSLSETNDQTEGYFNDKENISEEPSLEIEEPFVECIMYNHDMATPLDFSFVDSELAGENNSQSTWLNDKVRNTKMEQCGHVVVTVNECNNDKTASEATTNEDFANSLKCKYKDLDNQIDRILNPTPTPPPTYCDSFSELFGSFCEANQSELKSSEAIIRRGQYVDEKMHEKVEKHQSFSSTYNLKKPSAAQQHLLAAKHKDCDYKDMIQKMRMSDDFNAIAETLQFIKENLNRNDESVKKMESNIRDSWVRMLALDDSNDNNMQLDGQSMSKTGSSGEGEGPTKVRALEEVVGLLKKHIQQRESEINGLGNQLRLSNQKIKSLEQELRNKNMEEFRTPGLRQDKSNLTRELRHVETERDQLEKQIKERITEKENAQVARRKARRDLDYEKEKHKQNAKHSFSLTCNDRSMHKEELHDRIDDLEFLNKSSTSDLERAELELDSVRRENRLLLNHNDNSLIELKTDNVIMREKLDRMNEISAENLLLQSDVADYQAELSDLRNEAKQLRSKCYELTEENRQCQAEIRDLRRYIELLKANKSGDSRQDLLNKIEYYQMEHDRLMDEIRRLKQRVGEVSPRSPRQRPHSPRMNGHASYPGPTSRSSPPTVKFSKSLERGRSPVADAIAASTASSLAAVRLNKDRSLSPAAALQVRDLTMDRYNQHLNRPDSPQSVDSDSTELLLKPQSGAPHSASMPSTIAPLTSDEDDADLSRYMKLSGSLGSHNGGRRSRSKDNVGRSPCKRSCSPINPGGFRSVSPKMCSTQNEIPDTARDRYPTKIKRSLPRRAFAPRSPADLRLGYCIKFTRPGGRLSRGTVKYIGHLPTRDEIFIGVELDGFDGRHSGTFQGTKYFTCPANKGIFTPFSKIIMAWE